MDSYQEFLENLDKKLASYRIKQEKYLKCKIGCSACCEKGDYPISRVELEYLMQGFIELDNPTKILIQENIKRMQKGGACPFLVNKKCSVYAWRPIICRVHGLAYLIENNVVKIPYCVNEGMNFSDVYKNGEIEIEPIMENLDTPELLASLNSGENLNLYDWLKV